jgi:7-cyano-7-deazaguanine synthase
MYNYIVLLSGGLDSVVNLYAAHKEGKVVKALTFDYGQRAFEKELKAAEYFCKLLHISHEVIELSWLKKITKTALVNQNENLPTLSNLDDIHQACNSAKAVWVPNRNGVFLNIAASFAESLGAEFIIPGFNKEEAATFPDNSPAFIEASTHAFALSTMTQVQVACFTSNLDKTEMVALGRKLEVDFSHLWSCYSLGEKPCGECESCQRSMRAFKANDIPWPWK